jgi:hypothetical protein
MRLVPAKFPLLYRSHFSFFSMQREICGACAILDSRRFPEVCPPTSPSMPTSSQSPNLLAALPPAVMAYIEASDGLDLDRILSTFVEDALVNEQLRNYWGKAAIGESVS